MNTSPTLQTAENYAASRTVLGKTQRGSKPDGGSSILSASSPPHGCSQTDEPLREGKSRRDRLKWGLLSVEPPHQTGFNGVAQGVGEPSHEEFGGLFSQHHGADRHKEAKPEIGHTARVVPCRVGESARRGSSSFLGRYSSPGGTCRFSAPHMGRLLADAPFNLSFWGPVVAIVKFQKRIVIPPHSGPHVITFAALRSCEVHVDGRMLYTSPPLQHEPGGTGRAQYAEPEWKEPHHVTLPPDLSPGEHTFDIVAEYNMGPAAVIAYCVVTRSSHRSGLDSLRTRIRGGAGHDGRRHQIAGIVEKICLACRCTRLIALVALPMLRRSNGRSLADEPPAPRWRDSEVVECVHLPLDRDRRLAHPGGK